MSTFAAPAPLHRPRRSGRTAARLLSITALVAIAVALAAVAWRTERHATALDGRAGAITSSAHRTLVDLLNAETGQRGFLVSGDPDYLQPYRLGSAAVISDLATLTRVSRTVPPLTADVAALHALTRSKLSELAYTLSLARSGHRHQALGVVETNSGQRTMDLVRARVANVERVAARLPLAARLTASEAQRLALTVDAVLVALALALGGWWQVGASAPTVSATGRSASSRRRRGWSARCARWLRPPAARGSRAMWRPSWRRRWVSCSMRPARRSSVPNPSSCASSAIAARRRTRSASVGMSPRRRPEPCGPPSRPVSSSTVHRAVR